MERYRKLIVVVFILLLIPCIAFPSISRNDVLLLTDKLIAAIYGVSAALVDIPRIELDGVSYVDSAGLVPSSIEFNDSDLSTYYASLSRDNGFISSLIAKNSSIRKNAISKAYALNLNKGDFKIDGAVNILGGDNVTLARALLGNDLSYVDIIATGNMVLSGLSLSEDCAIMFSLSIKGQGNRLILEIDDCYMNGVSVYIEPFSVLFE